MNKEGENRNSFKKKIDEIIKNKGKNLSNLSNKSFEEILEEVNIYHQEIEFQNQELKRIQDELEKSKAHYTELFQNAPVGYLLFDSGHNTISANQAFADIVGFPISEIKSKAITQFIHPDDQDSFYILTKNLIKNIAYKRVELRFKGKNKEVTTIADFNVYQEDDKTLIRMAVMDITERKKLETELINAKEKAENSDKLKTAFLANMSHEFRTPVNGILGFADLLINPELSSEKHQEYVNIIKDNGKRIVEIIDDLIIISEIDSGQMDVSYENININKLIESLFDKFIDNTKEKGLKLNTSVSLPGHESIIQTDRDMVYYIFNKLLNNAIKFTNEGSIEFGYDIKNDSIEFFVKDTGCGITEEEQNKIFDKFTQVDITDSRQYDGTGLGLSIAKSYTEMLGGEIWVKSCKNQGTCFYFSLPLITKHEDDKLTEENKKKVTYLIVEDDEISAKFLSKLLDSSDNKLLFAKTGIEAINICQKNPDIKIIFMDIWMPDMDGFTVAKNIREFNKDVVIIAQTANIKSGGKEQAIEAGCNDYLEKPINAAKLFEIINYYL